jgi:replication factor C subunit 2/4
MRSRIMELNASDERGIKVVRTKIKDFASSAVSTKDGLYPPYKIIILDEADSMTDAAQAALRRTMEVYSKNTRFCLICNYVSRIIDPLASRCAKFRFKPVEPALMRARLTEICAKEALNLGDGALEALGRLSGGDMRKAITLLQSNGKFYGPEVTARSLGEIAGALPDAVLASLVKAARSNSFEALQRAVTDVVAEGYPAAEILVEFFRHNLTAHDLTSDQKALFSHKLAEADKRIVDRADEFLTLLDVTASYARIYNGVKVL